MSNKIDRHALVQRHNPVLRAPDPLSPLAVGNGEFAFTADITGLQSFPEHYEAPLGTQSQWGWHSSGGPNRMDRSKLRLKPYDTNGRQVGYAVSYEDQDELFNWLRQNPHRLQLGQVGLKLLSKYGSAARLDELRDIEQTLDLWSGILHSRFTYEGVPVYVQTSCHPEKDQLGVRIDSPLMLERRIEISIAFPSPAPSSPNWLKAGNLNWEGDDAHQTSFVSGSSHGGVFERTMDMDRYQVEASWFSGELVQDSVHRFRLVPAGGQTAFEFVFGFGLKPDSEALTPVGEIARMSAEYWALFWSQGGAVELAGSRDPRAHELERRIVLSQFLTAIHCAGSMPPQETGLLYNTWFGKFHLEMHWWHGVQFALWGRIGLLRKSLGWYVEALPAARELAQSQGYAGARWPKMVGPHGEDSPSPIGPLLIWQQPHPIVYAELCYLAEPTRETLDYFHDIVMESAEFMASFVVWEEEKERYVLGPPVIPAQESHKAEDTWNPTFELEYWAHGLSLAQTWRDRLGLARNQRWEHVRLHLSAPSVLDGVYLAHENAPDTYTDGNTDHPSMLGALGMLPGNLIERDTINRTFHKVMKEWQWDTSWGWDFPMAAMTAARLADGSGAVDALLLPAQKNTYLANGHNYQRESLTAYLPGNGGLLTAVALMAAGWQGYTGPGAPGFPADGSWTVRSEGLNPWL